MRKGCVWRRGGGERDGENGFFFLPSTSSIARNVEQEEGGPPPRPSLLPRCCCCSPVQVHERAVLIQGVTYSAMALSRVDERKRAQAAFSLFSIGIFEEK